MGKNKEKKEKDIKKLYLIRAEDVAGFETENNSIVEIRLVPGARIVQFDDNPAGRGLLSANIRRVVGAESTARIVEVLATEKSN